MGKRTCYLCKNPSSKNNKRTFHLFPKNEEAKNLWCMALKIDIADLPKFAVVCSDHFDTNDLVVGLSKTYLKAGTVPKLPEMKHEHSLSTESVSDIDTNVSSCENTTSDISSKLTDTSDTITSSETEYFLSQTYNSEIIEQEKPKANTSLRLPKNPKTRKAWLESLNWNEPLPEQKACYICSLHFSPDKFRKLNSRTTLKCGSLPEVGSFIPPECTEAVSGVPQTPEYCQEKNNQICEKQFEPLLVSNVSGGSEENNEEAESSFVDVKIEIDSDGLDPSHYCLENEVKEIKPDVFYLLITGVVHAQLPDPSWGFHIENGAVPFVMYTKCAKLNKAGDIPTIKIKVVVFQDCEVNVYVCGKRAIIDKISTIEELEELLMFVKDSYT